MQHGIAPFLNQAAPTFPGWPQSIVHEVKKEAALQSFWETSHRDAIMPLIDAFDQAGMPILIIKGTALAYSLYPEPAMRRRGDTDIVVLTNRRSKARQILRSCGFVADQAPRALQEDWHCESGIGFRHTVDLHWRFNASATIARLVDRGDCFAGSIDLPRLARHAKTIGLTGNLILTCINRHSHGTMGYRVGGAKIFETDRLIWAIDIAQLIRAFGDREWRDLVEQALLTQTGSIVQSGLMFAQRALGVPVPAAVIEALDPRAAPQGVMNYFATTSGLRRLQMDVAAAAGPREKALILLHVLVPGDHFVRERFPQAQGWPIAALQVRRWIEGAAKLVQGRA